MSENATNSQDSNGSIDHTDPGTLRQLYHDEELSANQIGEMAGVTGAAVRYHMEKHDIERRDRYDAAGMRNRVEYADYRIDKDGYAIWQTAVDGTTKRATVHQLLCIALGDDPHEVYSDDTETHHKIPIPWLNTPENVELVTTGTHRTTHNQGERHHNASVSEPDAKEILRRLDRGETSFEVAADYDISPSAVRKIGHGENWSHLSE